MKNKGVRENLLENNVLHIDFTPIVLDSEESLDYATDKDQTVMIEGSLDNPTSFSIFTHPYPVPHGRQCAGLDIFCKSTETYKKHFISQLKLFKTKAEKNLEMSRETFLNIFATEEQMMFARELSENLVSSGSRLSYGSQNRNITRMYIYSKRY